jgi:hypothetical protein
MDTMEKVRDRAVEVGVYLPLGAYSKLKDTVSGIDRRKVKKTYKDFIDRGEDRVKPIERKVTARFKELRADTKQTATKATKRGKAAAAKAAPKMPRIAAPANSSGLAIAKYDDLTVGEIRARLSGLTQTDLAKVYKYERSNQNRSTVLEAVEGKLIELPIPTYDALTVDEINGRLAGLTEKEIATLKAYEADTKARQTVLERMDLKLS